MAKYDVTHTCGHTVTHQLTGKMTDRESRADWLATTLCSDCYSANKQAQRQADNAAAAAANQAAALPALIGSDKQITWAEKLRKVIIDEAEEVVAKLDAVPEKRDAQWPTRVYGEFVQWLRAQDSAKYWIDNREIGVIETAKRGNPVAIFASITTRRGQATNAQDHFMIWAETHRAAELAAYRAELQAKRDAKAAEVARLAEAEAQRKAALLAPLATLAITEATLASEGNGYVVRDQGHTVQIGNYGNALAQSYVYSVDGLELRYDYNADDLQALKAAFIARFAAFAAPLFESKAKTFTVANKPDAVTLQQGHYGTMTIKSTDGRTATGYVEYADWIVYQIGDTSIDSGHPEMERIAREARAVWQQHRTAPVHA